MRLSDVELPRRLILSAPLTLIVCITISIAQTKPSANSNPQSTADTQANGPAFMHRVMPSCPKVRAPRLQPPTVPRHHKVILSWNPSAQSANQANNAIGYCLYRSQAESLAKRDPLCENCERVNSVPIVGTMCVDNLAKDNAGYYYVVTAINAAGEISPASNEAPAHIPSENQPGSVPRDSIVYPECRSATGTTLR